MDVVFMKSNVKKFLSLLCLTSAFSGFLTQSFASAVKPEEVLSDTKCESVSDCKEEVLPDGTVKKVFANGNKETIYPDGTKETIYPDGIKKIVHPDGTKETIYLDGTRKKILPNGAKETVYSDGARETVYPNGDIEYINEKGHSGCYIFHD